MKTIRKYLLIFVGLFAIIGGISFVRKSKNNSETTYNEQITSVSEFEAPRLRTDRIHEFFTTGINKLPIVETITYTPRVQWLEGRAAWVSDYASYYGTSRHFIARSLNGKSRLFHPKNLSWRSLQCL